MFDAAGASLALIDDAEEGEDSIEAIVWQSDLPDIVKSSPLSYVATRLINAYEIGRLTCETLNPSDCPKLAMRLQSRCEALSRLNGELVTCAVVRLPGATYTLEINQAAACVEYWEVQST